MKNIFIKVKEFCKIHKKRVLTVIAVSLLTIIIIAGAVGGVVYSHARSNIKCSQEQLQKIALGKVPGEVLKVEKELNFEDQVFEYEFKIKDNMLQVVKLDSQYGVILGANNANHIKENKDRHDRRDRHKGGYSEDK